jgi:hypothetical protein
MHDQLGKQKQKQRISEIGFTFMPLLDILLNLGCQLTGEQPPLNSQATQPASCQTCNKSCKNSYHFIYDFIYLIYQVIIISNKNSSFFTAAIFIYCF